MWLRFILWLVYVLKNVTIYWNCKLFHFLETKVQNYVSNIEKKQNTNQNDFNKLTENKAQSNHNEQAWLIANQSNLLFKIIFYSCTAIINFILK